MTNRNHKLNSVFAIVMIVIGFSYPVNADFIPDRKKASIETRFFSNYSQYDVGYHLNQKWRGSVGKFEYAKQEYLTGKVRYLYEQFDVKHASGRIYFHAGGQKELSSEAEFSAYFGFQFDYQTPNFYTSSFLQYYSIDPKVMLNEFVVGYAPFTTKSSPIRVWLCFWWNIREDEIYYDEALSGLTLSYKDRLYLSFGTDFDDLNNLTISLYF